MCYHNTVTVTTRYIYVIRIYMVEVKKMNGKVVKEGLRVRDADGLYIMSEPFRRTDEGLFLNIEDSFSTIKYLEEIKDFPHPFIIKLKFKSFIEGGIKATHDEKIEIAKRFLSSLDFEEAALKFTYGDEIYNWKGYKKEFQRHYAAGIEGAYLIISAYAENAAKILRCCISKYRDVFKVEKVRVFKSEFRITTRPWTNRP